MAILGYNESTLQNSEIFKDLNELSNMDQRKKAIELIKNPATKQLGTEDIEFSLLSVRQYNNSISREAMKQFDAGNTILVYNKNKAMSVSVALPFITLMAGETWKTFVFVDQYVRENPREGTMSIPVPILHDLLVSAWISNRLRTNYRALSDNAFLQKMLTEIYMRFFIHVLNRKYSIKADRATLDTLNYFVSKFFLLQIFKSNEPPENIELVAKKTIRSLDDLNIQDIQMRYDKANPNTIGEFINVVKTASPERMKTLDLGFFMSAWMDTFHQISLLAIDTIEYLIFMILSLKNSNSLIAMGSRDLVTEVRNINKINEELMKLM